MTVKPEEKAPSDSRLKGAFCYFPIIGWIISLFFILTEKDDRYVRFNAYQGLLLLIVFFVVYMALDVLSALMAQTLYPELAIAIAKRLLPIIYLGVSLLLIYKSLLGERLLLPTIGKAAERQV
ncbi:MAG: hypothetical protein D6733_05525 [Methanobacteriota archaeon]|nr:MAG: hypothetical protein D6733_05525 [Euryarchaeota archaeon]